MKKIIVLVLILILLFTTIACVNGEIIINDSERAFAQLTNSNDYFSLEIVERTTDTYILRDRNTDVLYLFINAGHGKTMCPILNSDGTPKLYED